MSIKIVTISNYINHHQIPLSNALYKRLKENYCFIQTEPMEEERSNMGWDVDEENIPYLKYAYKEEELCRQLIMDADILLAGWQEREDLILPRLDAGKLTLRISERIYREGQWKYLSPRGLIRKYKEHGKYKKSPNAHLLCAGAYVPSDFSLIHAYPNKMYKFGYFPEFRKINWDLKPSTESIEIIWVGRFIELKHPEFVIRLAADLLDLGYNFHIHFVGSGEMEEELKERVKAARLEDNVFFYGFLKPSKVRKLMDTCHVHIFTSNYLEGWGAVVNEGMNSGLAEVVNSEVGAAPYLIKHGVNGLIYKEGSYEDFIHQVLTLMDNPELIRQLGSNAYDTIAEYWNANNAVDQLFNFYEGYINGNIVLPEEGPFSPAEVIAPSSMYEYCMAHNK